MAWVAWAAVATVGWAIWGLAASPAEKAMGPYGALVVATAVEFVIALVVWAVVGSSRTGGWSWWVVGGGVGAGIAYLALFKAFAAGGQVGPVVALTALYPALATLFAWLVMKDGLTFRQAVGVAFAVLAAALLAK